MTSSSRRIRLTYFVRKLPARIRRLAYCSRIRCTAAHFIFRHLDCPSSGWGERCAILRYALFRCDTLRYLLCVMTHWQRVVRISAKHTKLLIVCVISLRTLLPLALPARDPRSPARAITYPASVVAIPASSSSGFADFDRECRFGTSR